MNIFLNLICFLGTFLLMEGVAWFSHKYIMHGLLWSWHEDHHVHEPGFFEKNDRFFLLFAVPSCILIMLGSFYSNSISLSIGFGIMVYGACYFLIHDVFIHQRFKWFRQIDHPYFKAIRKAHYVHHRKKGKEDGECFGMLFVPLSFLRETRAQMKKKKG